MTTLSLLAGLGAIYFLFQNHLLFVIFTAVHLLADAVDGVIARHASPTLFGSYYDALTDALINFLAVVKIAYISADTYAYIIAVLFLMIYGAYFKTRMTLPIFQSRTITLLILTLLPVYSFIPQIAYLATGVCLLYSTAKILEQKASMMRWG